MRIFAVLILSFALAGCNRGKPNADAVRQGVIDYLAERGLNVQGMNVNVTTLEAKGNQADASVSITPKGAPGQGMAMQYHLEQRGGKWTVTGRNAGGTPHGGEGGMPPAGMPNPHGEGAMPQGMPPHGGTVPGSQMPPPENLPPARKP